jgi:O-antigen/teichoic acid export membrane protein
LGRALRSSLLSSSALQCLGAVTGILLARGLGPEERGDLAAVVVWPTVLVFVGGIGLAEAAMYFGATRPDRVREVVRRLLALALIQGAALTLLTAFVVYPLALGSPMPWGSWATTAMTLYYPLYFLSVYPMCLANGLGHHRLFHLWRLTPALVLVVAFAVLSATDNLSRDSAVVAYLTAQTVAGVAAAWLILRRHVVAPSEGDGPVVGYRDLLSYGWRSGVGTAASTLNERLDQLAIAAFLAPAALGYYMIAWTLTSLSSLTSSAVALAGIPSLAALDDRARRATSNRLIHVSVGLSLLVAVPLIIATPAIIELCFGSEFLPAVEPARILIAASVLLSLNKALGTVLRAEDRPGDVAVGEGLGLGVTGATLAIAVPLWGVTGAAVASCVAYSAVCILLWIRFGRSRLRTDLTPAPAAPGSR